MKKLLALLIACFMLFAFVGCKADVNINLDDDTDESSSQSDVSSNNSSELTSSELDKWWDDVGIEIEGGNTSSGTSTENNPDTPDEPENGEEKEDEGEKEEEKPSNGNGDGFNDYKPTEKDEGFGPWV